MLSNSEFEEKMKARRMTIEGAEVPDPRPLAPPVGYNRQPSMWETVRKMMQAEFARRNEEAETPEDAADMGDDEEDLIESLSQYERYDLEMELARRTDAEARKAAEEAARSAAVVPPSDGPDASKATQRAPEEQDGGKKPKPRAAKPVVDESPEQ